MKVLIAPDSFKGTLWSWEVAELLAEALQEAGWEAEVRKIPMADGGEGTAQVLRRVLGLPWVTCGVRGPLGEPVRAGFAWEPESRSAYLDMASAAGLALVPPQKRNPLHTTTYGVGMLIGAAVAFGAREVYVGVGGSATVDGGLGALKALGARVKGLGKSLGTGGDLSRVRAVDLEPARRLFARRRLHVLVDVQNPLLGPRGAAPVYGPQKGASPSEVRRLERGLQRWAELLDPEGRLREVPGTGAAGGLAFGLAALGATLQSGAQFIATKLGVPEAIQWADLGITGEGCLDAQTAFGKVPWLVLQWAQANGRKCILVGGKAMEEQIFYKAGAGAVVAVLRGVCAEPEDREEAQQLLRQRMREFFRGMRTGWQLREAAE